MRKTPLDIRIVVLVFAVGVVLGSAIGVVVGPTLFARQSGSTSAGRQRSHMAPLTTVTISRSQDVFEPFILKVQQTPR